MPNKLYKDQAELDAEFANSRDALGECSCELVKGELIEPGTEGIPTDNKLKEALKKQFLMLESDPSVPRFVLYQLSTGQRSMICIAKDVNAKLIFSYRDFDSRPPTRRVKETIQEAVDEFLEQGGKP